MKHRWSAPERDIYTTDRTCTRCGLVRRTRHDGPGFPWIEWRRAGVRVPADKTPPCGDPELTSEGGGPEHFRGEKDGGPTELSRA